MRKSKTNKKYTIEFKIQIVKDYIESDLGCKLIARKYDINKTQVEQ